MKYTCFLNTNYELIGLCNIQDFNKKISEFKDKSWSQIILSKKFTISPNISSIKSISKIYLNAKITSTKIIKTPYSQLANIEGLKITGKLLLVSGEICQNIIYIPKIIYHSVHSIKLKIPFSTYIIIDKKANLDTDKYSIYPCIQDAFIDLLDEKTLVENITLFLFARKIVEPILNIFIFKTFDTDEEMSKVEFDTTNKKLIVTSTGKIYNNGIGLAFDFKLISSDNITIKNSSRIQKNESADNFKNTLDDIDFEFGDIVFIKYDDNSKVDLTNYPKESLTYTMLNKISQGFKITPNKIIPYVFSNAIILNDLNNKPIINVEFDIMGKGLLVNSTGNTTDPNGGQKYFKMTLYDSDGAIEKASSTIQGNQNGNAFADYFNDKTFNIEDVLKLEYQNANRVKVTNFPSEGEEYTPKASEEKFEIAKQELIPYIEKLPNSILIKSKNDELVARIRFNATDRKFMVLSTGIVPDPPSSDPYFTLILRDSTATRNILTVTLNSNENGDNFKSNLNDQKFDYSNNRLILIYKDKTKIEITNYPNIGNNYIPNLSFDILQITNPKLVNKAFNNKITIFNDTNNQVSIIAFINTGNNPVIFATSTNSISTNTLENTDVYVEYIHYNPSNINWSEKILGKETASNFVNSINGNPIQIGIPMRLYTKIPNRIVITNYNNQQEYRLGEEPEFFKSDGTQILPYTLNYNKIRFKNKNNSSILFIYFDAINSTNIYIEPYSTGKINNDSDNFSFKILDSNKNPRNIEGTVNKNQTADLVNVSDNSSNISRQFEFGDILEINYSDPSLVEVSSFPDITNNYIIYSNSQNFKITQNGLQFFDILKNLVAFRGFNSIQIATIQFNNNNNSLIVKSSNKQAHYVYSNREYFAVVLKDSDGNVKVESSVKGNETANNFANILNNQPFNYNDIITLRYKERSRLLIYNYELNGQIYRPPSQPGEEIFKITVNGLARI